MSFYVNDLNNLLLVCFLLLLNELVIGTNMIININVMNCVFCKEEDRKRIFLVFDDGLSNKMSADFKKNKFIVKVQHKI